MTGTAHHVERTVSLDGTHVTWACKCGVMATARLENEYATYEDHFYRRTGHTLSGWYASHI